MAKVKPDWLNEGDGFADITLSRGLEIDGAKVTVLRMREPTVNDQVASDAAAGSDAAKELATMANLTQIAPADIGRLPLRDYKRLQVAFLGFID